jgi:hypothetical protein
MESLARLSGFNGMPADDSGLWALARAAVPAGDPSRFVIIGSSRAHLGTNLEVFGSIFGGEPPIQLAIEGGSPLPVLRHLADQDSFRGIVLCDLVPAMVFNRTDNRDDRSEDWIASYELRPWNALFERRLKKEFELQFACVCERFRPGRSLRSWWESGKISPPLMCYKSDRSIAADLRAIDFSNMRLWEDTSVLNPMSADEIGDQVRMISRWVDRIQGRGGRVVMIRFPVQGRVRAAEDEHFPRHQYWDSLASNTRALMIPFEDYPALSGFPSPDGSHLDYRDAQVFSRVLAEIVKEKLKA